MTNNSSNSFADFLDYFFKLMEGRSHVIKEYNIETDTNSELCSKCGGKCCKKCGCHFSPDDFEEISYEYLKKELEKGYISIDYVHPEMCFSSNGGYILRIRNSKAKIVDTGLERSPCILLTDTGCKLDYFHRPSGAKLLIPSEDNNHIFTCESKYSIEDCCIEWKPYQSILHKLVKYFKNMNIPCSL